MIKKFTSALLLGAVLVFGTSSAVRAQGDVLFDVETSTGTDTLFVGILGQINFTADATGDSVSSLTWPFEMVFSAGNVIGPISDTAGDITFSAAAVAAFESRNWNLGWGQGTDPDTLLVGLVDFGGPLWDGSGIAWTMDVTATGEGSVRFDSITLPPANVLSAVDVNALDLPIQYLFDGQAITFVIRPNVAPVCLGATVDAGTIVFGNPNGGTVSGTDDPDNGPGPLTYQIISAVNDAGTGPNNPFVIDGAGNWSWSSSNANSDDVGNWTLTFGVHDGGDPSDPTEACVVEFSVIAQQPLVCFSFGCATAYSNQDACVTLNVDNLLNPCKELGGFDLLFQYDASLLTFTGMDLVGSVLQSSGWEYFTYRLVSSNPAKIRIVAIADMNNSNQHPNDYCIDGQLANICFRTTNDRTLSCQSAWLMFTWDDCGDNTASSRDGDVLFIVADPANGPWVGGIAGQVDGGGIIMSSCGIVSQIFSGDGGSTGPADFPCANPDQGKPDPVECLYFINGKIQIRCPGDIDDRGDINLNGLAYEIADAVLYSNYFILGPSVFQTGEPGEAQIAASDVNADGSPLTVADLVYLIRVITGDATPIEGDILGGGPKVATSVGRIEVEAVKQGSHMTIEATSDLDMGAGLFTFKYDNVEISEIALTDRASSMDVSFQADNGKLRVLVYNIEDGAKIAAGSGAILNIAITGAGSIELVDVEAASFMGGALESNLKATVLPTAYALHQNYPNPFNPSTSMAADFPQASEYTLSIYNVAGQLVKTFAGQSEAGTLTIKWDGDDNRGAKVASGVYFYRMDAGDFSKINKMVLMK